VGDSGFGDALSEVAGDDAGEKRGAGSAKGKGEIASRLAQRADGREEAVAGDAADKKIGAELLAAIAAGRLKKAGQNGDKLAPADKDGPEPADGAVSTGTPADTATAASVRDALIALGVGMKDAADQGAATQAVAESGAAGVVGQRQAGARNKIDDGGPTMPMPDMADGAEEEIVPVRVVRQETHFAPVMRDALRSSGTNEAPVDASGTPISPAALARSLLDREIAREQTVAASAARALEQGAAVAAAGPAVDEPMAGNIGLQIADRIQQALGEPLDAEAATSASQPGDSTQRIVYAPAVRSIKLQLNPMSLGTVTITLTGGEEAIRVHLEAEQADTVGKVEQDRNILSSRLHGAGYAIAELTVSRAGSQGTDSDMRDSGRNAASQGDGSGGSARDGGAPFSGERDGRRPGERQGADVFGRPSGQKTVASEHVISGISYAGRFRPV
jgi:chemotaxis protein MotD